MSKRRLPGSSGNTPGKTAPKKSADESTENDDKNPTRSSRRSLFSSSTQNISAQTTVTAHSEEWTRQELAALVEYVALYWEGAHTDGWPSIKTPSFWENCSKAIVDATGLPKRTGITSFYFPYFLVYNFFIPIYSTSVPLFCVMYMFFIFFCEC